MPSSGWPLDATELEPYYERAAQLVRIHAFDGDELSREPTARRPLLALDGSDAFTTDVFYYPSPPTNFGLAYREQIVGSPRLTLLLHANAVELETDPGARTLERIRVRTLAGGELSIEARHFVLATGGIENARLLLASNRVAPAGVGNQNDLVGRYFMEHPHVPIGAYALWCERPEAIALYESYTPNVELGHMSHGVIASTAAYQRRERTLNFSLQLQRPAAVGAGADALLDGAHRLDRVLRQDSGKHADAPHRVTGLLHARTEQTPNPDSRVTLDRERDALGLPRARLDWRLVELDHTSLYRSTVDFAREIYRAHGGRIRIDLDPAAFEKTAIGFGFHHMGTTRMARRPTEGVVDEHCRVHGLDNLYVAGSSVFPTSGYANPTLTLLALALRLADRLRSAASGSAP